MLEYRLMAKRQRIWMLVILGLFIILAIITPQRHFFAGIGLGSGVSFYNLWLLQRKITRQAEMAEKQGKRISTGMLSRVAMVALGTLIVMKLEWSIMGYIIGLMTAYSVIMIDFIWFNRNK